MFPESRRLQFQKRRSSQGGAGLVMAIFLITVMALIITTIAQLQQSTGEAEALDIQSQRAFYAAESGSQLALTRIIPEDPEASIEVSSCPEAGAEVFDQSFTQGSLTDCNASVVCKCDRINPDEKSLCNVATIVSNGSCGSGQDSAKRTIEVRVQ